MMKLEKVNRLLVITITIVSLGCLLSACDSKNEAETDYNNLGVVYQNQGKLEDAIPHINRQLILTLTMQSHTSVWEMSAIISKAN